MNKRKINYELDIRTAKEWYNSEIPELINLALSTYTKKELTEPYFHKIKTVDDAIEYLNIDLEETNKCIAQIRTKSFKALYLLSIVNEALNKEHSISFTIGDAYYPWVAYLDKTDTYIPSYDNDIVKIQDVVINNKKYTIIGGRGIKYAGQGISQYCDNQHKGRCNTMPQLACATKEIADHMSKYFGSLIFESFYGDIGIKWCEKYNVEDKKNKVNYKPINLEK